MLHELQDAHSDGISEIAFSPSPTKNLLSAASWDGKLSLHDADTSLFIKNYSESAPLLSTCFLRDTQVASAGVSKKVNVYDINSVRNCFLGVHTDPIKCIRFNPTSNLIYSGSWDRSIKGWDPRCSPNSPVCVANLHGKCISFDLDIQQQKIVAVDSLKKTYIYNISKPSMMQLEGVRDQVLKYQMRCVRIRPDALGFAVSSVEGRVAWEYFNLDPAFQSRKYAFKCHRVKKGNEEIAYPVNSIAFHPIFGTFATGGGDGVVSVWDGNTKKRLWRLPPYNTSVSSLAFNSNGTKLGIAVSYTYEEGMKTVMPGNKIIIRNVQEEDVKPK